MTNFGYSPSGFTFAEAEPVAEITVDPIIEQVAEPLLVAEVLPELPKVESVKAANEISDAFFAHKVALPSTGGNSLIAIIALSLITAGVVVMAMVAKEVIK